MPDMATNAPKKPRKVTLSPEEERARQVLNISMRTLGFTNSAIGDAIDKSAQYVQQRRSGESRIRMGDSANLAAALDVPEELFRMDPLDAGSWILTNRSEQVIAASGWLRETADPRALVA